MQTNHSIKTRKSITLLGWFVLFSLLAHGIFFAIPSSQKQNEIAVNLSSPLQVTVITSRSAGKPVEASPATATQHAAITATQNNRLQTPVNSIKKPARESTTKLVNKTKIADKPANKAAILNNNHTESTIDSAEDINAMENSKSVALNHLHQQLKKDIRARFTYPRMARRMGWEGLVGISLHIENDGSLKQVQVARSSGYKALDDNARKTIQNIGRLQLASNIISQEFDTEIEVLYRLTD